MLQMFCEMVNIVLDTSQRFGIISHTEQGVPLKRVPVKKGRGFILSTPRGFISPAKRTAWFNGISLK
jgi:hypothetical protein